MLRSLRKLWRWLTRIRVRTSAPAPPPPPRTPPQAWSPHPVPGHVRLDARWCLDATRLLVPQPDGTLLELLCLDLVGPRHEWRSWPRLSPHGRTLWPGDPN